MYVLVNILIVCRGKIYFVFNWLDIKVLSCRKQINTYKTIKIKFWAKVTIIF